MAQGQREPQQGPPVAAIVSATLLALGGLLLGLVIGGGGEPDPVTVVQTVTVAETETVSRTRTVTVPASLDDEFADTDTVETSTTETDAEDCSPDYLGACIPTDDPGLGCADLDEREFDSIGDDPYGLDPDGDGIACET